MKQIVSFFICALSCITINAMEHVPSEIVTYNIAPRLDRDDRETLRSTNKFFSQTIISQSALNAAYTQCIAELNEENTKFNKPNKKHNEANKDILRKQGALLYHEEIYKLFVNNKKKLAQKVYNSTQYNPDNHNYITLTHGIEQNNDPFIRWLIETRQLYLNLYLVCSAEQYAISIDRKTIAETLRQCYYDEQTRRSTMLHAFSF